MENYNNLVDLKDKLANKLKQVKEYNKAFTKN